MRATTVARRRTRNGFAVTDRRRQQTAPEPDYTEEFDLYARMTAIMQRTGNVTSSDYQIRVSERWNAALAAAKVGMPLEGQSA